MNIASGNSAIKIHWSKGALTACNKKMSVGKEETKSFGEIAKNTPEICCKSCLNKFKATKQ